MTNKDLLQNLGFIDPELIVKAAPDAPEARKKTRHRIKIKYIVYAACFLLVFAIGITVLPNISLPDIFMPSKGDELPTSRLEQISPDSYSALLYSTNGTVQDNLTDRYQGKSFDTVNVYTKENMPDKTADIFGRELTLSYHSSENVVSLPYNVDRYTYKDGSDLIYACYRSGTDKLIYYSTPHTYKGTHQPSSEEFASEKELLEYARGILLEDRKSVV